MTPTVVAPTDGYVYATEEAQVFIVNATDPDGDAYAAQVGVRNTRGNLVRTFATSPSPSGMPSSGTPVPPLPPGTYTVAAYAFDAAGGTSTESPPRTFTVEQIPRLVPDDGLTRRLSIDTNAAEANDQSDGVATSADGRFATFTSRATNLVPGDSNNRNDIFVRDRASGTTTRVSVSSSGVQANNDSRDADISADGRYVVFVSSATNLVSGDTNARDDVFLHDRATGLTTRVSVDSANVQGNGDSDLPSISANGRYVTFGSRSSNLVAGDTNAKSDVFVRDRTASTTTRASVWTSGAQGADHATDPAISADGRYVAFVAWDALASGDTNAYIDVYVRDRVANTTKRVSVSSGNAQSGWGQFNINPSISDDGRYVAFDSMADLAPQTGVDDHERFDVFVRDIGANTTDLVSDGTVPIVSGGPDPVLFENSHYRSAISADGLSVAFVSAKASGIGGQIYVHDRPSNQTVMASEHGADLAFKQSDDPVLTADGRRVLFESPSDTLVVGDTNDAFDIFARDLDAPDVECVQSPGVNCVITTRSHSDTTGLEDFYAYEPFPLGAGSMLFANTSTGNGVVQATDLSVPGNGLNLRLTRTYNAALDGKDGPLGRGWTLGVSDGDGQEFLDALVSSVMSLDLNRAAEVLGSEDQFDFYDADGTRHHFVKGGSEGPGWHSPPGINLTLSDLVDPNGKRYYVLTRPDGVAYEFRPLPLDYRLTKVSDRNGNFLDFAYTDGRLQTITDTAGRTITFTWSGDYLTRARYSAAGITRDTDYAVNAATKRLTSVTEAAGDGSARTTSYVYDGRLIGVTDPRGNTTQVGYDGDGRVTAVTDRAGKVWTISYGGAPCPAPNEPASASTCVTDPDGHTSTWFLSPTGNPLAHRDAGDVDEAGAPRFNTRHWAWDSNRVIHDVDEAGNATEYAYNVLGQITESRFQGAGEPTLVSQFTYAHRGGGVADLTEIRAGVGSGDERRTRFAHDATGNLTSVTDPLGAQTTFTYHAGGRLKTITDARNNTTTYGDAAASDKGYDASGQPKRITDPLGNSMTIVYDFMGLPTETTDRNGKLWRKEFDRLGRLTKEIDPLSNDTWHCYDANSNEILTVRPTSSAPSCALDGTDGHSVKRTFDARDLLFRTVTASDTQIRKHEYRYADDGQLSFALQPRSFSTSNADFALIGAGQSATYDRYPNNRIRAFTDEEGAASQFTYTPNGLIATRTEPSNGAGNPRTTYTYTGRGQVKTELVLGHSKPVVHAFNVHGERVKTTDAKSNSTVFDYDSAGRLVRITDPNGSVTTRGYDAVGNLTNLTQPTGTKSSVATSYTHTARNEIASEVDPGDPRHTITYEYDGAGRQRFRRDRYDGVIERTTEQRYDDAGRLLERIASFPGTTSGMHRAVFSYDANGNRTGVDTFLDGASTPNLSSLAIAFTSANEPKTLTETLYPPTGAGVSKASTYAYHADGLLRTRTVDGQTTTYAYLLNGRESSMDLGGGADVVTRAYFENGAPEEIALPGGTTTNLGYDVAGRLTLKETRRAGGTLLSSWERSLYDDNDNRTAESVTQRSPGDGVARTGGSAFTYDKLDRLTASKHPFEEAAVPLTLDDTGNVTQEGVLSYTYEKNRLQSREIAALGAQITYAYDHFGNMSEEITPWGTKTTTYDAASHTLRVTDTDGSWVQYAYDGLDRQVRRTTSSGDVELYFSDGTSATRSLETDAAGAIKTRYFLDSRGEPMAQESTSGRGYFVTDPRANVTQLLDGSGQVKAVFAYDPMGDAKPALSSASAGWDSRLRYQTAPQDPKTGAYSLGPRMYDPAINRFAGADSYVAASANLQLQIDPLTGNRYLYAGANPANLIDDGHSPSRSTGGYTLNPYEARWCFSDQVHAGICVRARKLADKANRWAAFRDTDKQGSGHGWGNAYRHMFWASLMTIEFGSGVARQLLLLHEGAQGQDTFGRRMDLWNNDLGVRLGTSFRNAGIRGSGIFTQLAVDYWVRVNVYFGCAMWRDNRNPRSCSP